MSSSRRSERATGVSLGSRPYCSHMLPAYVSMARVSCGAPDQGGHELPQALTLVGRKTQAELRAPPQHVVFGLRPFALHEIADLRAGEIGAQARPELLEAVR